MVTQRENRNVIIKKVINEINGLAFGSSQVWSERDRAFFENRYSRIFSLFPEIKKNDIGLEVGLCGGIMAFSLKKFFLFMTQLVKKGNRYHTLLMAPWLSLMI